MLASPEVRQSEDATKSSSLPQSACWRRRDAVPENPSSLDFTPSPVCILDSYPPVRVALLALLPWLYPPKSFFKTFFLLPAENQVDMRRARKDRNTSLSKGVRWTCRTATGGTQSERRQ